MAEKLTRWFLFGVIVALLPVIFNYLHLRTRASSVSFDDIAGRGELLLVAAGIAATAIGDLLGSSASMKVPKIIAGGFSVIVLGLASLYFADVAAAYLSNQNINAHIVSNTSLTLLLSAIVTGGSCIALAEVK